jgi:hypothetical protein
MAKKRTPEDKRHDKMPELDKNDPLRTLERERDKLEQRFNDLTKKAQNELGEAGFWGFVGGVAIMADWAFMGGLGTAIAVWSGAEYIAYKTNARRVEKDLKKVQERIIDMQEERFRAQMDMQKQQRQPGVANDNSLKDEFSPAAKAEIEALQKKLAELSGQVDKLQEDKEKGLDKPKFKPPFGKKP